MERKHTRKFDTSDEEKARAFTPHTIKIGHARLPHTVDVSTFVDKTREKPYHGNDTQERIASGHKAAAFGRATECKSAATSIEIVWCAFETPKHCLAMLPATPVPNSVAAISSSSPGSNTRHIIGDYSSKQRVLPSSCLRLIDYLAQEKKWRVFNFTDSIKASVVAHILLVILIIWLPVRIIIQRIQPSSISMQFSASPGGNKNSKPKPGAAAAHQSPTTAIKEQQASTGSEKKHIGDLRQLAEVPQPPAIKSVPAEDRAPPRSSQAPNTESLTTNQTSKAASANAVPGSCRQMGGDPGTQVEDSDLLSSAAWTEAVDSPIKEQNTQVLPSLRGIPIGRESERDESLSINSTQPLLDSPAQPQFLPPPYKLLAPDKSVFKQEATEVVSILQALAPEESGMSLRSAALSPPRVSDAELIQKIKPVVPSIDIAAGSSKSKNGDSGTGLIGGATFSGIYCPSSDKFAELYSRFGFFNTLYGPITPDGPVVEKTNPLPVYALAMVSIDDTRAFFLGENALIDTEISTGLTRAIELPQGQRQMGWASGIAYDSNRDRLLVLSFGGNGYVYSYGPVRGDAQWSLVTSTRNALLSGLIYCKDRDCFYTLEGMATGKIRNLCRLGPDGQVQAQFALSEEVAVREAVPQTFLAGDSLIVFANARYGEKMIAVIDVTNGRVKWKRKMRV